MPSKPLPRPASPLLDLFTLLLPCRTVLLPLSLGLGTHPLFTATTIYEKRVESQATSCNQSVKNEIVEHQHDISHEMYLELMLHAQ
ncbi:hypothetical protein V8F20_000270 [Naviculisporaceae sp. PSN 640]